MRARGAGWASVGAGTILVLVGAVVLALVSTVVAFQGWPGADASAASATPTALLAAAGTPSVDETVEGDVRPIAVTVPAARTPAPTVAREERRERRAPVRTTAPRDTLALDGGRTRTDVTGSPDVTGVDSADTPTGTVDGTRTTAQAGDGVRDAGKSLGGTLGGTVEEVGNATAPASPQLDETVGDVGVVVEDTVKGVTNTVGVLLDALGGSGR